MTILLIQFRSCRHIVRLPPNISLLLSRIKKNIYIFYNEFVIQLPLVAHKFLGFLVQLKDIYIHRYII